MPRKHGTASAEAVVALAGRPNTGKTTLFNALTGLRQRVANFSGTTVEKAVGTATLVGDCRAEIIDLPGTPSILPATADEFVAFDFLAAAAAQGRCFQVLCVAEASNLENDLAFALSLKECGYPTALVVNMVDEAVLNGIRIDRKALEESLGLRVIMASARTGQGLEQITQFIAAHAPSAKAHPGAINIGAAPRQALQDIHAAAIGRASEACRRAVSRVEEGILPTISKSMALDRWLFHPVVGPLILAAVMVTVFEALFTWATPARDALSAGFALLAEVLRPRLGSELAAGLLCDGVIPGISAVVQFVPQIAILFTLIGILEQSGYLPRAAAMVDRALRPFGLDGKVFIPFLSSFACAIPGVMATRTIPSAGRRLTAVLLAPLMTCSARLPVYTLIIGAFVPSSLRLMGLSVQGLVMAGMYAFGIAVALALAWAMKWTTLYERSALPVTVLPPYRFPKPQEMARYVWTRCWHFIEKAGRIIFLVSVVLWALASFPGPGPAALALKGQAAELESLPRSPVRDEKILAINGRIGALKIENSALGRLGHAIEPVFRPIGYDWRISIAVIASIAAREVFVGTLGSIFALGGGQGHVDSLIAALHSRYGIPTAVSLLIFFAIAMQCISTIAVVRRETGGWKWPAIQFSVFFALAYSLAWAGFHLTRWLI